MLFMSSQKFYRVVHSSPEFTTVGEYIDDISSPAHRYVGLEEQFLLIRGEDGLTNQERLELLYTEKEKGDNNIKIARLKLLKVGVIFYIPYGMVETVGLLTQGIEVVSNDVAAFKAKQLALLESNPGYERRFVLQKGSELVGDVFVKYPTLSIWIWSKALSDYNDSELLLKDELYSQVQGELINITPFITKVTTNVTKSGGSFSISLAPITCRLEISEENGREVRKWSLKRGSVNRWGVDEYWGQDQMFDKVKDGELKRSQFFFHKVLQSNDLVFIKFESLKMEDREGENSSISIGKDKIYQSVFDMIGLIDNVPLVINPANNDVSVEISGRDLSKLLQDDGTYFFNLENITGQHRIAGKATQKNQLMGRLIGSNSLYYLSLFQNNSIQYILQFIIQQLSTISVVPDNLFSFYGDEVNTFFTDNEKVSENQKYEREVSITEKRVRVTVVNYEAKLDFLKHIRENNTRRVVNGRTVGWSPQVYLGERLDRDQLPSTLDENRQVFQYRQTVWSGFYEDFQQIDNIITLRNTRPKESTDRRFQEKKSRGIWQIIKLLVDKSITNRRLVDSSMSSGNGAILSFIQKACQEPFVEFYMDTYGDKFYLIARKPPWDKKGILSYIKYGNNTEEGEVISTPVIDIEGIQVEKEDLDFETTAYSWYTFRPQNVFAGGGTVLPVAYVPALFFEEYAEVWGSNPFSVVHSYNPYYPYIDDNGYTDLSRFEIQAYEDLRYIVESHAYLPFTRKGTITITGGDRRMKRGNWIRYKPTGEIFFVEGVQNNQSITLQTIERETIVTVSRGMVEEYIEGVEVNGVNMSYFDIINTDIQIKTKKYSNGIIGVDREKIFENMGVNKNVFLFFLKRHQFGL